MRIIPIHPDQVDAELAADDAATTSETGRDVPSRRTFGRGFPSRRTFGRGLPSRRTFGA
jgi:hypothetical protein